MYKKENIYSKALIVGGANGIGAGLTKQLLDEGYKKIYIGDCVEPIIKDDRIVFLQTDLRYDNLDALANLDIDTLIITAGNGYN
ncbi:MAG TPA: hypothetical protein PLS05_07610 [Clostridia bacterium]|jgi:NAD(P)-dependent dehydrogenase (short-subunit alcohol dehydrogenase family)|nr:hypothetical protein [Clostridia bacterium]HOL61711.1 hypothetical protein [Clostridia bacterium]HPO54336.1 hypothetical protein [Clostridia bacterium]